ncbi:hypothetical protein I4I83_02655 [Acidovorax cattleyae]|nr:hypothetical protein [Paracidovorax cattleyae]MBF9263625.1 hypothetical protein [Paracidovorax cattleyae]
MQVEARHLLADTRPQRVVGQQPIQGGPIDKAQIAIIALISAHSDQADTPANGSREMVELVVGLHDLPRKLQLRGPPYAHAVHRLVGHREVTLPLGRGSNSIFSIPRPWPGEGILRAYPGCVGQRHDSLDNEFLCAVPRPVIRSGDDRSVGGREQQRNRFEDRRLSNVTSTQDDVHPLRREPSQGLDASETLNAQLADLRG